eukprot:tig00020603_g11796.t1
MDRPGREQSRDDFLSRFCASLPPHERAKMLTIGLDELCSHSACCSRDGAERVLAVLSGREPVPEIPTLGSGAAEALSQLSFQLQVCRLDAEGLTEIAVLSEPAHASLSAPPESCPARVLVAFGALGDLFAALASEPPGAACRLRLYVDVAPAPRASPASASSSSAAAGPSSSSASASSSSSSDRRPLLRAVHPIRPVLLVQWQFPLANLAAQLGPAGCCVAVNEDCAQGPTYVCGTFIECHEVRRFHAAPSPGAVARSLAALPPTNCARIAVLSDRDAPPGSPPLLRFGPISFAFEYSLVERSFVPAVSPRLAPPSPRPQASPRPPPPRSPPPGFLRYPLQQAGPPLSARELQRLAANFASHVLEEVRDSGGQGTSALESLPLACVVEIPDESLWGAALSLVPSAPVPSVALEVPGGSLEGLVALLARCQGLIQFNRVCGSFLPPPLTATWDAVRDRYRALCSDAGREIAELERIDAAIAFLDASLAEREAHGGAGGGREAADADPAGGPPRLELLLLLLPLRLQARPFSLLKGGKAAIPLLDYCVAGCSWQHAVDTRDAAGVAARRRDVLAALRDLSLATAAAAERAGLSPAAQGSLAGAADAGCPGPEGVFGGDAGLASPARLSAFLQKMPPLPPDALPAAQCLVLRLAQARPRGTARAFPALTLPSSPLQRTRHELALAPISYELYSLRAQFSQQAGLVALLRGLLAAHAAELAIARVKAAYLAVHGSPAPSPPLSPALFGPPSPRGAAAGRASPASAPASARFFLAEGGAAAASVASPRAVPPRSCPRPPPPPPPPRPLRELRLVSPAPSTLPVRARPAGALAVRPRPRPRPRLRFHGRRSRRAVLGLRALPTGRGRADAAAAGREPAAARGVDPCLPVVTSPSKRFSDALSQEAAAAASSLAAAASNLATAAATAISAAREDLSSALQRVDRDRGGGGGGGGGGGSGGGRVLLASDGGSVSPLVPDPDACPEAMPPAPPSSPPPILSSASSSSARPAAPPAAQAPAPEAPAPPPRHPSPPGGPILRYTAGGGGGGDDGGSGSGSGSGGYDRDDELEALREQIRVMRAEQADAEARAERDAQRAERAGRELSDASYSVRELKAFVREYDARVAALERDLAAARAEARSLGEAAAWGQSRVESLAADLADAVDVRQVGPRPGPRPAPAPPALFALLLAPGPRLSVSVSFEASKPRMQPLAFASKFRFTGAYPGPGPPPRPAPGPGPPPSSLRLGPRAPGRLEAEAGSLRGAVAALRGDPAALRALDAPALASLKCALAEALRAVGEEQVQRAVREKERELRRLVEDKRLCKVRRPRPREKLNVADLESRHPPPVPRLCKVPSPARPNPPPV